MKKWPARFEGAAGAAPAALVRASALTPERIEFWTRRPHRLHERRLFTRDGETAGREGLLYP